MALHIDTTGYWMILSGSYSLGIGPQHSQISSIWTIWATNGKPGFVVCLASHNTHFLICNHLSECLSFWKDRLRRQLRRLHLKRFVDCKHETTSVEGPRSDSWSIWKIKTAIPASNNFICYSYLVRVRLYRQL